jgi:hypothetical protein
MRSKTCWPKVWSPRVTFSSCPGFTPLLLSLGRPKSDDIGLTLQRKGQNKRIWQSHTTVVCVVHAAGGDADAECQGDANRSTLMSAL